MKISMPGNRMYLLRKLLLLVFVGIFLFSLFKVATKLYAYQKENKAYESIRASVQRPDGVPGFTNPVWETADDAGEPEPSPLPYTVLRGDPSDLGPEGIFKAYSALKAQNADLVGWINMPGFHNVIDYPVMQSSDNDFYLSHDFYKNKSYSGSIFMDAVNMSTEPDRNMVIYGHAMENLSMFGNLVHYPDEEKYGKDTAIYLDLLDTHLEYQVFSAYSTESSFDYRRTTFADDADFLSFLNTIKGKSEHDFGVSLSPQDKIITLSTCDRGYGKDGRTVIHARLVRQIIYDGSGIGGVYAKAVAESDKKIISSNVYLESLLLQYQVTNADGSGWKDAVLDPPFKTNGKVFSTKVPAASNIAKLTVTAADPKASLSYALNGNAADPDSLALIEGDNVILLQVVSVGGLYSKTYTIHVFREPSPTTSQPGQTPSTATKPAVLVPAAANQP